MDIKYYTYFINIVYNTARIIGLIVHVRTCTYTSYIRPKYIYLSTYTLVHIPKVHILGMNPDGKLHGRPGASASGRSSGAAWR